MLACMLNMLWQGLFQLDDLNVPCRLEDHEKDRMRVVGENETLKQKLKALVDQFEARDNHFNQQVFAQPYAAVQSCSCSLHAQVS